MHPSSPSCLAPLYSLPDETRQLVRAEQREILRHCETARNKTTTESRHVQRFHISIGQQGLTIIYKKGGKGGAESTTRVLSSLVLGGGLGPCLDARAVVGSVRVGTLISLSHGGLLLLLLLIRRVGVAGAIVARVQVRGRGAGDGRHGGRGSSADKVHGDIKETDSHNNGSHQDVEPLPRECQETNAVRRGGERSKKRVSRVKPSSLSLFLSHLSQSPEWFVILAKRRLEDSSSKQDQKNHSVSSIVDHSTKVKGPIVYTARKSQLTDTTSKEREHESHVVDNHLGNRELQAECKQAENTVRGISIALGSVLVAHTERYPFLSQSKLGNGRGGGKALRKNDTENARVP